MGQIPIAILLVPAILNVLYCFVRLRLAFSREKLVREDCPGTRKLAFQRSGQLLLIILGILLVFGWLPGLLHDSSTKFKIMTLKNRDAGRELSLQKVRELSDDAWMAVNPLSLRTLALHQDVHFWFKINIPVNELQKEYVTELHYPLFKRIEFASVTGSGASRQVAFGEPPSIPLSQNGSSYPRFSFVAPAGGGGSVYVHLIAIGLTIIPLEVREQTDFAQYLVKETIIVGLALGCLLGILLYNISLFLALRDRIYLNYALYQGTCLGFIACYNGLVPGLIGISGQVPLVIPTINSLLLSLTVLAFIPFLLNFLDERRQIPWMRRLLQSGAILMVAGMAVLPFQMFDEMFLTQMSLLMFVSTVVVLVLWPRIDQNHIFNFLIGFVGLYTCVAVYVMTLTNTIPSGTVADHMIYIGAIWDGIFVSQAIADQIALMKNERRSLLDSFSAKTPTAGGVDAIEQATPASMQVSIMFIDIANFALIADALGSVEVYRRLSKQMSALRKIIAAHHGTVDRSLGDGLLCFFADHGDELSHDFVKNAFKAAIEIQRMMLSHLRSEISKEQMLMPLRIGLHIDEVMVGNLGGVDRVDFTMIGKGVNFTHKLESACSPFKIITSHEFLENLENITEYPTGFNEIHIAVSYQEALLKAFEFNPIIDESRFLEMAEESFAASLGLSQRELRVKLGHKNSATLSSSYGIFRVSDLSPGGFGVTSGSFIGRKAVIAVQIEVGDQNVAQALRASHLESIQVEVRWCRCHGDNFEHGMRIVGLNTEQKEALFALLSGGHSRGRPEVDAPIHPSRKLA